VTPGAGGETITSTRNPRVRAAAALHRRRERDETSRYLLEGPRYIGDLLPSGDVEEIFAVDPPAALLASAREHGVPVTHVSPEVLDKIATSVTPQGVVAVARQRHASLTDVLGRGFTVVLVGIADPGNAGAIIRTATAAGAAGVVFTAGSVDPWNPKAVRASAGAVGRVPVVVGVSTGEVIATCRESGDRLVALDASGETTFRSPSALAAPVALIFGNEAHGLDAEILSAVDLVVSIPRYGPVESLNLAAAVAVTTFQAVEES
jgi:RNA methyltransferase, TrmH family